MHTVASSFTRQQPTIETCKSQLTSFWSSLRRGSACPVRVSLRRESSIFTRSPVRKYSSFSSTTVAYSSSAAGTMRLVPGQELDDDFTGLADADGFISVAGFGSLLSQRSARSTFPDLINFRVAKLQGYRRVFAHCADIFYQRGIAKPETGEVSSLSCEPCPGEEIVISVFEVKASRDFIKAFIEREHEFRFLAVEPLTMSGVRSGCLAVLCGRYSDEEYKARRCPPDEFERRWAAHGVTKIWRDDILPCRVYLRHCVLAAKSFGPEAYGSFLDHTFLADRTTTIRQYLKQQEGIMEELPPPELAQRYNG